MIRFLRIGVVLGVVMVMSLLPFARPAAAVSTGVVISQVYAQSGKAIGVEDADLLIALARNL